jgi:hypothetical protein
MTDHLPLLFTIIAVGISGFALIIGLAISVAVQP